jgi:hypothetical protein
MTLWTLGMSTSSSLVASAIVYWIVERNLVNALIIGGTGFVVFILTLIFAKKPSAPPPPPPLMNNSGNATASGGTGGAATATGGSVTQHFHGTPTGAAAPAPAPIPKPEAERPTLELLSCEFTMIAFDNWWVGLNSTDIKPQRWKPNAFVGRFRLKPTPVGKKPLFAHDATAHLIYRNDKGETQVVDYGTWLGVYEHKVSFRGNSHSLILSSSTKAGSSSDDGQTYVFDNPHSFDIFSNPYSLRGSTINPPNEKLLLPNCTQAEVHIRTFDTTLFTGIFDRDGDGWKPRVSEEKQ